MQGYKASSGFEFNKPIPQLEPIVQIQNLETRNFGKTFSAFTSLGMSALSSCKAPWFHSISIPQSKSPRHCPCPTENVASRFPETPKLRNEAQRYNNFTFITSTHPARQSCKENLNAAVQLEHGVNLARHVTPSAERCLMMKVWALAASCAP